MRPIDADSLIAKYEAAKKAFSLFLNEKAKEAFESVYDSIIKTAKAEPTLELPAPKDEAQNKDQPDALAVALERLSRAARETYRRLGINPCEAPNVAEQLESTPESKLDIAKRTIKEHFKEGDCGLFYSRNTTGDPMETIYDKDGLAIDICYDYQYFEVFGLSDAEFAELDKYYGQLCKEESDG